MFLARRRRQHAGIVQRTGHTSSIRTSRLVKSREPKAAVAATSQDTEDIRGLTAEADMAGAAAALGDKAVPHETVLVIKQAF